MLLSIFQFALVLFFQGPPGLPGIGGPGGPGGGDTGIDAPIDDYIVPALLVAVIMALFFIYKMKKNTVKA